MTDAEYWNEMFEIAQDLKNQGFHKLKGKKKMGRKAKPKLTQQEAEDEVILKYMNWEPMTLEESALALHMYDKAHTKGYKAKKPITRMGFLKMEMRIMEKLRKACEEKGIGPEILQMFGNCKRQCATGNYGNSIDAN